MKKRVLLLFCLLSIFLCIPVQAIESRTALVAPKLSFSGTTACCSLEITEPGKNINATMKLLENGSVIEIWSENGRGYIGINETASAQKGSTYKLIATVSIDGATQPSAWVTKKCE